MDLKELESIEKQIDECIDQEDFQKLNVLLERRFEIIKAGIPEEMAKKIYEKDREREKIISQKLKSLKDNVKNLERGKQALKGYGSVYGLKNEGGRFKGQG
ncbi:RNA-binding protein [Thermosipho ferrireducens]|uniref:RNA-binding protein n=1 Tax=Thermosipho ferrireducens TaxID=2571116 RepID=A0ABX7S6D7_9BACT|nr:RNA-binding protein [Thermosipho ferrireducens]QTA38137.1 RNA-binding protein [Thermosipho ferrireducens]